MTETNRKQVEDYFQALEGALAGSGGGRAEEVVAEVRADLEARVERLVGEGTSEDEAVATVLADLGNPYELAHHVKREAPPFGGRTLTVIRYLAAVGVAAWTVLLLWTFRAWTYGFDPGMIGVVVFFHLPVVLLLWPRLVWRRNWLFGLIPAGLAVVVALGVAVGGVESSSTLALEGGEAAALPTSEQIEAEEQALKTRTMWIALALSSVTLVLLAAMQQRAQRRLAVVVVLAVIAVVEVIFQGEEYLFRKDRDLVRSFAEAVRKDQGAYPDAEEFKAGGPALRSGRVWSDEEGERYQIFWDRPLSSGFAIVYDSDDDRVRIQD